LVKPCLFCLCFPTHNQEGVSAPPLLSRSSDGDSLAGSEEVQMLKDELNIAQEKEVRVCVPAWRVQVGGLS